MAGLGDHPGQDDSDRPGVDGGARASQGHLRVYEDRDDNNVVDAGEGVRAKVALADRFTGRAVATGRSRTDGVPAISGVPTSSYILRVAALKGNHC